MQMRLNSGYLDSLEYPKAKRARTADADFYTPRGTLQAKDDLPWRLSSGVDPSSLGMR